MVQTNGGNIRVSFFIVVLGQAIPRTAVNPHGFTVEKGKTVVRNIVLVLEKITEVHLSRRAKAQAESWSEALTGYFDMITVDDIGMVSHCVHPQSDRGRQWLVDVRSAAKVRAASGTGRSVVEALETRRFADLVDDDAGGTATKINGSGTLEHFDAFDVKSVPKISALIANAIKIHVVARIKAAQGEAVALRSTGFTGGYADAGNIAHRVAQARCLLLVHDLSWDD